MLGGSPVVNLQFSCLIEMQQTEYLLIFFFISIKRNKVNLITTNFKDYILSQNTAQIQLVVRNVYIQK